METTYSVHIWKITVYNGMRGNTYYVRWIVDGKEWKEPFKAKALADSFRADLLSAQRKGEAFDIRLRSSGLDVTDEPRDVVVRVRLRVRRHEVAPGRRNHATYPRRGADDRYGRHVRERPGQAGRPLIRSALCRWAFNT